MAKGYTDFLAPLMGIDVSTKPRGEQKYLDWEKALETIKENPTATIEAGLQEDWNNTSGVIYDNGEYIEEYIYNNSSWATPILDVDGKEIECWTYTELDFDGYPENWLDHNKKGDEDK